MVEVLAKRRYWQQQRFSATTELLAKVEVLAKVEAGKGRGTGIAEVLANGRGAGKDRGTGKQWRYFHNGQVTGTDGGAGNHTNDGVGTQWE